MIIVIQIMVNCVKKNQNESEWLSFDASFKDDSDENHDNSNKNNNNSTKNNLKMSRSQVKRQKMKEKIMKKNNNNNKKQQRQVLSLRQEDQVKG